MRARASTASLGAGFATALVAAFQLRELVLLEPRALALRGRLIDDAFFYTIVARRLSASGVPSFDGEMTTNGLQPGWTALTLLVQSALPTADSLAPMLWISWLLYAVFAGALVAYLCRRCAGRAAGVAALAFAALIALNPAFQRLAVQGLETPLLLALAPLFLVLFDRLAALEPARALPIGANVALALVAAALFFARTDWFWASVVSFAWIWRRGGLRAGGTFALVTALCVAPYLATNLAYGGSLIPISGRVKLFYLSSFTPDLGAYLASDEWRGFVSAFADVFPFGHAGEWLAFPALLAAATYTILRRERLGAGLVAFGLIACLHVSFMQLFYRELRPYTGYYFALELVWIALLAAFALGELAAKRPRLALGLAAGLALGVMIFALRDDSAGDLERYWGTRLALADDIRRVAPAGERVAAFWPGAFSYFSGRDVIPLDGVIGSRAYFDSYVREGRELDFVRERRAAYLALHLPIPPEELRAQAEPPPIRSWADLGTLRLWQHRDVPWRTVAARTFTERGGGWYLIEFPWRCCR